MTEKFLNQLQLTSTFTPNNTAIVASDNGQVVAEKTQGQLNAVVSTGFQTVFNGIEDAAQFSVTYSAANKQFSVTTTASAAYTVGGVRYVPGATTTVTTAHANTTAKYYCYYAAGGAIAVSSTFWNLLLVAPIAMVYFTTSNAGGAAAGILQYELHAGNPHGMDNATHLNLHSTRGTQLVSGCVASGYTLNTAGAANVNWGTTSGSIADEDIVLTVAAQAKGGANNYRILYLTGTTATPLWNWKDNAEDGIYSDGTDIYYNQNNAGTWQLTAITSNNRWVNYYIVATTAYNTPQIIVVMGQKVYTSLSTASLGTFGADCSNFGLFTSEAVVLYQVTYRRASADGAPGNAEISAFTQIIQNLVIAALTAATTAANVSVNTSSFANFFSASDNNVQQALNDLDAGVPFSLAHGGTNANLTASNGGIFYSSATAGAILAGTATAGQVLRSGASTTPAWSTATYPATTTINRILYSSAANVVDEITTGNNGTLITSAGGVPSISSTLPSAVQGNITATGALASGSLAAGFTAVTVPLGGTGVATTTAYGVLCGGTTTTGAFQNAGAGTATQVLTSNGNAALPSWADPSAGALTSYAVATGNVNLALASTAWQNITGTVLTLPAGTYLINYFITVTGYDNASGSTHLVSARLYNNTDAAAVAGTTALISRNVLLNTVRTQSGCGGATVVVVLAAQKTIQMQASTDVGFPTPNGSFSAPNSTFTALKIG